MVSKRDSVMRGVLAVAGAGVLVAGVGVSQVSAAVWPAPRPAGVVPAGGVLKIRAGQPNTTVMGNLTVTQPAGAGHTTMYPCNQPRPTASVNNFVAGQTVPNFTVARTDPNGDVCVYTSATAHLLWDQVSETDEMGAYTPVRKMDTRASKQRVGAGGVLQIQVLPPTDLVALGGASRAVFGNLTVVNPSSGGYTTVYPCSQPRPAASVNNFVAGQTSPNFAASKVGVDGKMCVYSSAATDLVWDQSADNASAAHAPVRMMDTRVSKQRVGAGGVLQIDTNVVQSQNPVQGQGAGVTVFGNLTVVNPSAGGYTTVYPCDQPRPTASVNNFVAGRTSPNFAVSRTSADGKMCVYSSAETDVVWDQVLETNSFGGHAPVRLADTRSVEPVFSAVSGFSVRQWEAIIAIDAPSADTNAGSLSVGSLLVWHNANVTWNLPAGMTVKKVYLGRPGVAALFDTSQKEIVNHTDTSATLTNLSEGTTYRVGVVAVDANGRTMPTAYTDFYVSFSAS